VVKFDRGKLMAAVDAKRRQENLSWERLGWEFGFNSVSSIHRLRTCPNMSAHRMVQFMLWLDVHDIRPFLKES